MAQEVIQAGRFENTRVYVHRRSKKQGAAVDGRYVRVGGVFRLGTPSLKSMQFMGIHSCMFLTISYPDYVRGILDVAADLAGHADLGQFTWSNYLTCKVLHDDLWYFIPAYVWGFKEGEYDKTIKTHSTLSILQGLSGGMYYVLNVPLITRKYLRARYKKPVGRKKK
jgi:hypothetical protein